MKRILPILCFLLGPPLQAQVDHLAAPDNSAAIQLVAAKFEQPVSRFKKQAVQSVAFSGGWLQSVESGGLSSSSFETSIGIGVPLSLIGSRISGAGGQLENQKELDATNILGITPSFRVDYLDAAAGLDVPDELFETGVSFFYRKPIHDRLSATAIARPSVRSDFTTSQDAFRIFGLAMMTWDYAPETLSLSFGVVYLDRADLTLLPAAGLTWTPQPATRLDLRFPESRLAWRLAKDGGRSETWSYVSAGLGGNTWAVTRPSGTQDELSLRDLRASLGVEHIVDGGGGWFVEAGYAFERRIEYESDQSEIALGDGVLLQAGWRY